MISAEQIVKVFGSAPLPTALELQKYGSGYADGREEFGELIADHSPGTFFADCAYLALWPSPSTALITIPSGLHIMADESKWDHYLEPLSLILAPMERPDQTFYLSHFLFTFEQAQFTWECLHWFANDPKSWQKISDEQLNTKPRKAAATWRSFVDRLYFWDQ